MVTTMDSAWLYECQVHHTRTVPWTYRLRHRTFQWLVDLDRLPRPPWPLRGLARFRASDHIGDPALSIKDNIVDFAAGHGVDLTGGRIRMLAHARSAGYVFNPLTVFWCHDRHGSLACVIAEVHNTYRQRHAYLLRTGPGGGATTDKRFHVSPFLDVAGRYRLRLPEPGERLSLAVVLEQDGRPVLGASVTGRRHPAGTARLLWLTVRHPLSTLMVSAAIRRHGIRLYLRGLPIRPRPGNPRKETHDRPR